MSERLGNLNVGGTNGEKNPTENIFGNTLKKLIADRGIKGQRNFSRRVCVSETMVSTWINGHEFPGVVSMGKILAYLKPEDEDLDNLVNSWSQSLTNKKQRDNVAGIPYGGTPSEDPLGGAIHGLMLGSEYKTQKRFARVIEESPVMVSAWIRGENVPSADVMGKILVATKPDDEELESLIEPWSKKLQEAGRLHITGKKLQYVPKTAFAKMILKFVTQRDISVQSLGRSLGFSSMGLPSYENLSVQSMSCVVDKMRTKYKLDPKKELDAYEAVAQTIEERVEQGKELSTNTSGMRMRFIRDKYYPKRYLIGDVADMLGVGKRRVGKLMKDFGITQPMKRKDVAVIAEKLKIDPKDKWTR